MTRDKKEVVRIQRATRADELSIFALLPQLVAFGPPPWRDPSAMTKTDRKVLGKALRSTSEDPIVLIAVLEPYRIVGFLHVHSVTDYYTEKRNGHIADIVVAEDFQGRGIGKQLLNEAEDWARAQNYEWLTISVFPENLRALRTYEKHGFKPDIARLLKPLR
jgi:ribosomal protein S18 acetylase RimI-like enzyme